MVLNIIKQFTEITSFIYVTIIYYHIKSTCDGVSDIGIRHYQRSVMQETEIMTAKEIYSYSQLAVHVVCLSRNNDNDSSSNFLVFSRKRQMQIMQPLWRQFQATQMSRSSIGLDLPHQIQKKECKNICSNLRANRLIHQLKYLYNN